MSGTVEVLDPSWIDRMKWYWKNLYDRFLHKIGRAPDDNFTSYAKRELDAMGMT